MVQITGKYEHTSSSGFVEILVSRGVPEEGAKSVDQDQYWEIKQTGDTITVITKRFTHNYEVGKEVEEKGPTGVPVKTLAKLNGNVLNVESKYPDGKVHKKDLVFSDSGVEEVLHSSDGKTQGRRVFKRI